jgi:hypothetical protein
MNICRVAEVAILGIALSSCANYTRMRGVENAWRNPSLPAPVVGETTQAQILDRYGPPSQIIGLDHQTVFYYLTERNTGSGTILIVYNWLNEKVTYDRAIFFFDSDAVLADYGFSRESIGDAD